MRLANITVVSSFFCVRFFNSQRCRSLQFVVLTRFGDEFHQRRIFVLITSSKTEKFFFLLKKENCSILKLIDIASKAFDDLHQGIL
jgi:hypothetical protein